MAAQREADLLAGELGQRMQLVTAQLSERVGHLMDIAEVQAAADAAAKQSIALAANAKGHRDRGSGSAGTAGTGCLHDQHPGGAQRSDRDLSRTDGDAPEQRADVERPPSRSAARCARRWARQCAAATSDHDSAAAGVRCRSLHRQVLADRARRPSASSDTGRQSSSGAAGGNAGPSCACARHDVRGARRTCCAFRAGSFNPGWSGRDTATVRAGERGKHCHSAGHRDHPDDGCERQLDDRHRTASTQPVPAGPAGGQALRRPDAGRSAAARRGGQPAIAGDPARDPDRRRRTAEACARTREGSRRYGSCRKAGAGGRRRLSRQRRRSRNRRRRPLFQRQG